MIAFRKGWIWDRLTRHVATEILRYTVLGFLASVPVLVLPGLLRRADDYLVPGLVTDDLWIVLGATVLLVAAYAIPVAFSFGLLLAIGRLCSDHEIFAMRACGVGTWGLLRPAIVVAALMTLVNLVLCIGVEHRAWRSLRSLRYEIAARGSVIEPGRFQRFGSRMILARERDSMDKLRGIVISDWTDEEQTLLVFAETADLFYDDEDGKLHFVLRDGDIRMDPGPSDQHDEYRISFSNFDYAFSAGHLGGKRWRFRPSDLDWDSLRRVVALAESGRPIRGMKYSNVEQYQTHLHKLVALPMTPVLFALVGVPLGALGLVTSRARAALLALLMYGGYYAIFTFGYDAARVGRIPPALGVWASNIFLLAVGIVLVRRLHRGAG